MTQWVIITMHHAHQVGHLLAAATLTPIASWGGQNFHAEQRQCIANREALPTLYPPAPHIDTAYGSMLARSDTSIIPAQRRAFAPPPGAETREAQPAARPADPYRRCAATHRHRTSIPHTALCSQESPCNEILEILRLAPLSLRSTCVVFFRCHLAWLCALGALGVQSVTSHPGPRS